MIKEERKHLDVYLRNKTKKGTDWPNVVKELRLYLNTCEDEQLDILKWEIMRYKKSYDMNNYFSVYMVMFAILSIFYNMFNVGDLMNRSKTSLIVILTIVMIFVFIFIMFPFIRSTAKHMTNGHYFDIYSQLIEEEIGVRAKIIEIDEKRMQGQECVEYIMGVLDSRSLIKRLSSLFRYKQWGCKSCLILI